MRFYLLILSALLSLSLTACKDDAIPDGSKFPPPSQEKKVAPPPAKDPVAAAPEEALEEAPAPDAPAAAEEPAGDPADDGVPPPPEEKQVVLGDATDGIIIEGVTKWDGKGGAVLNIDLIKKGPPTKVVYSVFNVPNPGAFKIQVPRDLGDVHLYAFLEKDGNVVAGGIPKSVVTVEDRAIDGVQIVLKKGFKLGKAGLAVTQGGPADDPALTGEEGGDGENPPPPSPN